MSSQIDTEQLIKWCSIPINELESHADAKVKIKILNEPDDVYQWVAREMVEEVKANNEAKKDTRWILPCGPTKQYTYFCKIVNYENISLKNVRVFHMDDHLDWQGRPLPLEHKFSYEGWMRNYFYAPINSDLAIPEDQRHFPNINVIDEISEKITEIGGIDTVYGGVGYRGFIAYNEPPRSPWYTISDKEFKESKTRILHLNDETLIALSQRIVGGCSHVIPPMAITLGMKDLLSAKRIRIFSETGSWKQTVIRVLLFGPITTEYPVTFIQDHPDAMVVVDKLTATPPFQR